MSIQLIQGDITKLEVDAIVNAANSSLLGGGGVDGAIHRAGGPDILKECMAIRNRQGGCATGEAVITSGGRLKAKFVIHTVGPVWHGGNNQEDELLANAYTNSLKLAASYNVHSIAFPNISTGVYGFPKKRAAEIAVTQIRLFLDDEHHSIKNRYFLLF
jgi:O-acetyl-ADP-ribose deacetylase (regulator of RNase III)